VNELIDNWEIVDFIVGEVGSKYHSRPSIVVHLEYKAGMPVVPCSIVASSYSFENERRISV
jgi:hypothetical protein